MTIKDCRSCASTLWITYKHLENLKLFLSSGALEFVSMDVLVLLPRTTSGRHWVFIITDLYLNFTRAIPTAKPMASVIA